MGRPKFLLPTFPTFLVVRGRPDNRPGIEDEVVGLPDLWHRLKELGGSDLEADGVDGWARESEVGELTTRWTGGLVVRLKDREA